MTSCVKPNIYPQTVHRNTVFGIHSGIGVSSLNLTFIDYFYLISLSLLGVIFRFLSAQWQLLSVHNQNMGEAQVLLTEVKNTLTLM